MSKLFWHQRVSQFYMKAVKVKPFFLLRQFVLILGFCNLQIEVIPDIVNLTRITTYVSLSGIIEYTICM
jgi:hypothetical protein